MSLPSHAPIAEARIAADTIPIASVAGRACGLDVHVVDAEEAPDSLRARATSEGLPL